MNPHNPGFRSPGTINEALELLAVPGATIVAGGTDLIPHIRGGQFDPECLIDISRLPELKLIQTSGDRVSIGAMVTHDDIVHSAELQREAVALVQAASHIGCPQTRNRGTLGGNIANASPAGDTLPPLIVLGAQVHLLSQRGERTLNVEAFLTGPGKNALEAGEMIYCVSFARLPERAGTVFVRLGSRGGMAVSIASAAAAVLPSAGGGSTGVRLAVGAVAPTPIRCLEAERLLLNLPMSEAAIDTAARAASLECQPIDDVRASVRYRRHAVYQLVRQALRSGQEAALADEGRDNHGH